MVRRLAALLVAGFFAGAGCAPADEETVVERMASPGPATTSGVYVGQVDGSDALLGLVSDGTSIAGFMTDGQQLARWMRPTPIDGNISQLASREGDHFMGGIEFFGDGVRGEVFIDDAPFSFDITAARGEAGVYWQVSGDSETGWVRANDGEFKGLKRVGQGFSQAGEPQGPQWTDPNGEPFRAAPEPPS